MAPQYISKALINVMEMGWKWRERKKYTISRKEEGMKDNRRDEKLLLDYVSDINSDGVLPRWIFVHPST